MAKMEKFEDASRQQDAMGVIEQLFDVIENLKMNGEKLYYGSVAYEDVLKVCRNKITKCITELDVVVDIIKIMSFQPDFLKDADAENVEKEIVERTDLFYEQ